MSSKCWKRAAATVLVAAALTACGTQKPAGPVFATAGPVAAAKPDEFGFKRAVRARELEGLNETVRRNLAVVLRPREFSQSLQRSLANDEMLAPDDSGAIYVLTPIFVDLRTAPVSDDITAAQAIIRYRVVRREDGTAIFDKSIKTEFTSVADPAFDKGGVFSRTLRMVGLSSPNPGPVVANRPGSEETRAPGPERDSAREIHAARNAIALNIRTAMRYLVAASPERLAAPVPVAHGSKADTEDQGGSAVRAEDATETEEHSGSAASAEDAAEPEEGAEPESPESDGKPSPPLAPEINPGG